MTSLIRARLHVAPVSVSITVVTTTVNYCVNGDRLFDRQIGFTTHSACQCKRTLNKSPGWSSPNFTGFQSQGMLSMFGKILTLLSGATLTQQRFTLRNQSLL